MDSSVLRPEPIIRALQGAFCRDASPQELLVLAAGRIHGTGAPYGNVRVYLLRDEPIALAASAGDARDTGTVADLTVPIRRHDEILGGIDVRSDGSAPFGTGDEEALREIADALAVLV
ncbi:MAG: hypothetical protein AMS20_14660 [Gemmatimonas sp. SG8_28]|nr:MAG: hypothetical protein AMS20_14660 [Gemmatimonas sp. SG8_28]